MASIVNQASLNVSFSAIFKSAHTRCLRVLFVCVRSLTLRCLGLGQYLRLGALGLGAWYGLTRQASLERLVHKEKVERDQRLHEDLIEEGRVAYEAWENRKEATLGAKDNSNIPILFCC